MVTPAPLTTVPITSTNKNFKTLHIFKRKFEENISLAIEKKSTETTMSNPVQTNTDSEKINTQTKSTFRIPKITRPNDNETSETKSNCSPTQQSSDESNTQQGKRKFSLSQYKEHKRLKSTESPVNNYSGDVDMRIVTNETVKNTSPKPINDDSSITSPKTNDNSKDLILKSNLSEPGVKKVNKKKVIWADEKNQALVHTSIFEIDISEKADMHAFARQCAANISLAQIEKLMERDLRKQQGLQDPNMNELDERLTQPVLPRLIRILLPESIVIPTVKSQERLAQEEREKTVLQAFSFRSFLPDCPGEPDCDINGNTNLNEPKLIPVDDIHPVAETKEVPSATNNTTTSLPTATATPAPIVPSGLSSLSLENVSPEVAKILAQAQVKVSTTTTANSLPTTTVNTSISQTTPLTSTNSVLPSIPNANTASNLLSTLLNLTRPNSIDPTTSMKIDALLDKIQLNSIVASPTNPTINPVPTLPLNFNLSTTPNPLAFNPLILQALALGFPPPANFNNPMFPLPMNSNPPTTNPSPSPRFSSPSAGQQPPPRFNNNQNNTDHHSTHNTRGNHRGRGFRRGGHNHSNRRDHFPNRNNNNRNPANNNRNMFT